MRSPKNVRRRPTLAEVAARAGVSVTTASFVLSGRTDMRIATVTADRVVEAAQVLNYVRARRVSTPAARRLPVIGFVSDNIAADFGTDLLHGAMLEAAERGHGVLAAYTEGERSTESGALNDLVERGIEHFVYSTIATQRVTAPPELRDRRVILLNCVDRRSGLPSIVPDDRKAGALAAQVLLDAGHGERIWVVGEAVPNPFAGRERMSAITRVLERAGHTLDRHVACLWWPPDTREALTAALADTPRSQWPTAMIAMNDRIALGVYEAAALAGLAVPRDLSVVSFDNGDLAWWLQPGLTSIGLPLHEMGRRAVRRVLADDPDERTTPRREVVAMPLHARESVGPPPVRRGRRSTTVNGATAARRVAPAKSSG